MLRGIKLDRTATGRRAFFRGCDGNYAEWLAFTGDASTQPSVHITVAHGDVTLLVVGRADTLEDALTRAEDAINDAAPNIYSTYLACLGRNRWPTIPTRS